MTGNQLLEFEFAAAAAGRGTGDAGNAFRIGNAIFEQLFDLLRGGAAAVTNDVVIGVVVRVLHKTVS